MSKVEEKSRQYFLDKYYRKSGGTQIVFDVPDVMTAYEEGYRQAEKDLELTWRDIEQILDIINNLVDENFNADDFGIPANKDFYQEVLKRFNKQKGED